MLHNPSLPLSLGQGLGRTLCEWSPPKNGDSLAAALCEHKRYTSTSALRAQAGRRTGDAAAEARDNRDAGTWKEM